MSDREPPSAAAFESGDISHALTQIARLAEGVKSEFDLVGSRISWLVIAESFLFPGFALALVNYRLDHPFASVLVYVVWAIPIVGMVLAASVYVAILAAHSSIAILKDQRDRLIECLPERLRIDLISSGSRQQWWGNVPTHVIPPVLFLIWGAAWVPLLR
ncbi:MAG TPA: hypothetical protein VHV54_06980 [Candidatus Binatia bacterium]|nr:hypothetical protein [Candidatus Binatia bacterium]